MREFLIQPAIGEYPDLTPPQVLPSLPANSVARRAPPPADTSMPAMKVKSHRYYLARHKQQRAVLDKRIALLERELAALTRPAPKRRTRRASRA